MAIRLTEARLRKIIREEAAKLVEAMGPSADLDLSELDPNGVDDHYSACIEIADALQQHGCKVMTDDGFEIPLHEPEGLAEVCGMPLTVYAPTQRALISCMAQVEEILDGGAQSLPSVPGRY